MATLSDSEAGNRIDLEFLNLAPTRLTRKELIDFGYWMDIRSTVRTADRSWTNSGQLLTAEELEDLVEVLHKWADRPDVEDSSEYTEPNLSFAKHVSPGPRIRLDIGFDDTSHPDPSAPAEAGDPYWVPFEVDPSDLRRFASELHAELIRIAPGMAR